MSDASYVILEMDLRATRKGPPTGRKKKMTIEEQLKSHADLLGSVSFNLDRLSLSLDRLADTAIVHDAQIEALIQIGEKHDARLARTEQAIAALTEQVANTERQWQAYINTLPRH
jgi:hypothetical protein